jgi:ABC-2 type transport system ATP-binding protein
MSVWLERLGIPEAMTRPVRELSKGAQQKVQFIAAVLPDPALLLLDEPFGALDPVSRQQLRAILQELAGNGKTILLSSHEMAEMELLCSEVVMVHHGRTVLSGSVAALKEQFSDHAVLVRGAVNVAGIPGIVRVEPHGDGMKVHLAPECRPSEFLQRALAAGASIEHFALARPSLEDIFVQVVKSNASGTPAA